jgi:hypothetical protein
MFIDAYFDESESFKEHKILTVAGYIFEREKAENFHNEWYEVLKASNIDVFHMVDNAHGNGDFRKIKKDDRIILQKNLVKLISKSASFGIAVSVDLDAFSIMIANLPDAPDAFTFCCRLCCVGARVWADERDSASLEEKISGISYFFEAGNSCQQSANKEMSDVFNNEVLRQRYRYVSHSFIPKRYSACVQAADMLAWLHGNSMRRYVSGRGGYREDYKALVEGVASEMVMADAKMLRDVRRDRRRAVGYWSPVSSRFFPGII